MDPVATIQRLRDLLGGDHSGHEANKDGTVIEHPTKDDRDLHDLHLMLCEAEELWQALDDWIGFRKGWRKAIED